LGFGAEVGVMMLNSQGASDPRQKISLDYTHQGFAQIFPPIFLFLLL